MALGRFFLIIVALFVSSWPSSVSAGWWFGKKSAWEKSGLDLSQGYDQNTVISLSGAVVSIDLGGGKDPALAVVQTAAETVTLVLGPRDFWQEKGIPLKPGDSVSVRGSKAQGQDGVVYLMVQTIAKPGKTPNDLQETTLRTRIGRPAWAGTTRVMQQHPVTMRQIRNGRNR